MMDEGEPPVSVRPTGAGRGLALLVLADPAMGVPERLGGGQEIVPAERVGGFPLVVLAVDPRQGDVVEEAVFGLVSPDGGFDRAVLDFVNRFLLFHRSFFRFEEGEFPLSPGTGEGMPPTAKERSRARGRKGHEGEPKPASVPELADGARVGAKQAAPPERRTMEKQFTKVWGIKGSPMAKRHHHRSCEQEGLEQPLPKGRNALRKGRLPSGAPGRSGLPSP